MTIVEELREIANAMLEDAVTLNQAIQYRHLLALADKCDGKVLVPTYVAQYSGGSCVAVISREAEGDIEGWGDSTTKAMAALQVELDKRVWGGESPSLW